MPVLVVAEKPSVARDIAYVVGARSRNDGFFSGGDWIVTWAIGHLVALAEPHEMNAAWKRWRLADLPLLPPSWPLVVADKTRSQFDVVRRLLLAKDVRGVVCATDAGREGELIFRYIYEAAKAKKPVKRLWISSLTPDAISNGFKALKDASAFDRLADAARARSRADWLVGMNLSRVYSVLHDDNLSVGRVQTPTLAMIVARELEIRAFVPEDYLEVVATFAPPNDSAPAVAGGESYQGTYVKPTQANGQKSEGDAAANAKRLPADGKDADAIVDRAKKGEATIASVDRQTRRLLPPQLYDLTELQRHANRLYSFTAQRTLQIAQNLYEQRKLISYPRTDSRHLSKTIESTLPAVVAAIEAPYRSLLAPGTGTRPLSTRFVDDKRVSDHHAIIPTQTRPPEDLPSDERKIYDLVCRRLLSAWHGDHVFAVTTVQTEIAFEEHHRDRYVSTGTSVEDEGWKVLDVRLGSPSTSKDANPTLPGGLAKGMPRRVTDAKSVKKTTRPPPRLNDATLLTAMETAGRALDEKEISDAMRERGLGTPATRASILETLLRREYIVRDGKMLQATDKGVALIDMVHAHVKSPAMTGEWEAKLARIEKGEENLASFMDQIERYVREVVAMVASSGATLPNVALGRPAHVRNERAAGFPPRAPAVGETREPTAKPPRTPQEELFFEESERKERTKKFSHGALGGLAVGHSSLPPTPPDANERDRATPQYTPAGEPRGLTAKPPRTPQEELFFEESERKERTRKFSGGALGGLAVGHSSPATAARAAGGGANGAAPPSNDAAVSELAPPMDGGPVASIRPVRSSDIDVLLESAFGFTSFRPYQRAVCEAAKDGKDVLLVMPTGAGKSLCYQLPGIARGGTTLVVSPLIALMEDQVAQLVRRGFIAERIHSGRQRTESRAVCKAYLDGALDFLFIAPERLKVPGFPEMLARRKPTLIAIDEAHCISQWGHDFRPDYRMLGERLPLLRPAPVIALTATATPTVQDDIVEQLRLAEAERFIHGFRRTNIAVEVVERNPSDRADVVVRLLDDPKRRPAIVYAPTRSESEQLVKTLRGSSSSASGPGRLRAAAYHAGLPASERDDVQSAFLAGKIDVIVATTAFGMGIDKADVRSVIHTALPATVEGYYQEIGRAGRDGAASRAILLHAYVDTKTHEFFFSRDYPDPDVIAKVQAAIKPSVATTTDALRKRVRMKSDLFEKVLEKLWVHGGALVDPDDTVRRGTADWRSAYDRQRTHKREQLERMRRYADTPACRMLQLVGHFGDQNDSGASCGICDVCAPLLCVAQSFRVPTPEESDAALAIIEALRQRDGRAVGQLHRDLFAAGDSFDRKALDHVLGALVRAGHVRVVMDDFVKDGKAIPFQRVWLADPSSNAANTKVDASALRIVVTPPSSNKKSAKRGGGARRTRSKRGSSTSTSTKKKRSTPRVPKPEPTGAPLEAALRTWRTSEAKKRRVPAFRILTDRALIGIALLRPTSEAQLLAVAGMGMAILAQYGKTLISIVERTS